MVSLLEIIQSHKNESQKRLSEFYIKRHLTNPLEENDLIKVILGPRRCGKSFLAMHLVASTHSWGYVNFDDERLADIKDYDRLIDAVNLTYGNPTHLLLDEIQNVPRWELFVNRLQRQGLHLLLTGSNAHLLGSELATHLTGRHERIVLFPFSFREYLLSKNADTGGKNEAVLQEYLVNGGYPEITVKQIDPGLYLSTLLDSILFKDIVRRYRIRAAAGASDLVKYLLSNVASEYSFQRLMQVTRGGSQHTIEKYLRYLEEAFLFFSLRRFSYKVREQTRANRKIYCIDNGFISAGAFTMSPNTGCLAENAVAVALHKQELDGVQEIFFWKNAQHHEVDFVVVRNRKVDSLIQVCWNFDSIKTREREIHNLLIAGEELKCTNLIVLNEKDEREEVAHWFGKRNTIRFIPLEEWLKKN